MKRPFFSTLLISTAVLALAGCSTVDLDSNGDTQAVYELGTFEMLINSNASATYNAAQAAMKEMDLYQLSAKLNNYDATIIARSRNDEKISIKVREINSRQSLIDIRWGSTGNRIKSRLFFEATERNLH